MKQIGVIVIVFTTLISCGPPKGLYSWGGKKISYEKTSYNYLKNQDEASTQSLDETYKEIITNQKGMRGVPPPGIFADYGFLLIQRGQTEKGKEMLMKEISHYPEGRIFIERILKMIV